MNYKTHRIAGMVAAEVTLLHFQQPLLSWETPVAIIGGYALSLLSDIDKPTSKIGRKLWLISQSSRMFSIRHRTLTHSIPFTVLLFLFFSSLQIPDVLIWAWIMAFCSHWFIDLFNEAGVELLWPIPIKFRLLPFFLAISSEDLVGQRIFRFSLHLMNVFLLFSLCREYFFGIPFLGPPIHAHWEGLVDALPVGIRFFLYL